jgi:hypothetical protein
VAHQGMLVLKNGKGKMRIYYIRKACGEEHLVEQTMTVNTTSEGTNIVGTNPFDVNENGGETDYVADNFYIVKKQSGAIEVWNIDAKGSKAQVDLKPLTTEKDATWWLEDVNWD